MSETNQRPDRDGLDRIKTDDSRDSDEMTLPPTEEQTEAAASAAETDVNREAAPKADPPPEPDPAHEPASDPQDSENESPLPDDAPADETDEEEEETIAEQRPQEIERRFAYLENLLDEHHYADFREEMETINPVDAADFFTELPHERIPAVFKMLKKDTAAEIFAELDIEEQERLITAMTDRELSFIVEELALDDATDMVRELPANVVTRIMRNATPETRADINHFLSYPDDSAGSVMTAEFIDLRRDMTCSEAIAHIRLTGVDKETVYIAYVTDSARILQGSVPLKSLLFADPDSPIEDIMDEEIICASTMDDQETVANTISKYDMLALPIVDKENRLVGIVTVDDAMDVMETEATEDIEKMAAILPTDKPYLKTGVCETWRKRIPWLLLLMVSATFTSTILTHYESALGAMAILTAFVPMLMDTGGNAGGQTSVTIIRGLSLGEIELRDVFRVLWKEVRVAALCGVTVAAACFVKTMIVDFRLSFTWINVKVSLIVCLTMFCAILFAKIVGTLLPIGAKKLGFDPAVMASPFITTIVDTLTLLIYFAIASTILHI